MAATNEGGEEVVSWRGEVVRWQGEVARWRGDEVVMVALVRWWWWWWCAVTRW